MVVVDHGLHHGLNLYGVAEIMFKILDHLDMTRYSARWYKNERLPKSDDFRQSAVGTTQMIQSGHIIACWKGQSLNHVGKIVSDLFQTPTHR